ncbi:MAG: DUF4440 domain-containing protein [Candidatus Sulfotelmatobacter sp.]
MPRSSGLPADSAEQIPEVNELYRRLQSEMRRPKPGEDEIAVAMEAAQRLAAEMDAEDAADDAADDAGGEIRQRPSAGVCTVCGHHNRKGTKFCGMCGVAIVAGEDAGPAISPLEQLRSSPALARTSAPRDGEIEPSPRGGGNETHHYHHHYHHHYFPEAGGGFPRVPANVARDVARDEKMRPNAAMRGEMSRAEAAVRRVTQEWVLACNTKHLDDLLELYTSDALVLRSNCPPIRGAAALREFYFGALDAGLGEVEMEPLRVDVVGDLAYEAGRFKALIPSATGKRREERGKYLWVCARQNNGEWKLAADCWSSDLTLSMLESDIPAGAVVKTSAPRKNG